MQPLVIYFNEKSLSGNLSNYDWQVEVQNLCKVIDDFFHLRSDGKIRFFDVQWSTTVGEKTLADQFRLAYKNSRDKYRRFLSRVEINNSGISNILHEVHWRSESAYGITLADSNSSWVFGILKTHYDWNEKSIACQHYKLDSAGNFFDSISCDVRNISSNIHLETWRNDIIDWGLVVSPSCILDYIGGHAIVMYSFPLEHNPPHVHILHKESSDTFAKYNIADCSLEKGKATFDADMKIWINKYKDQLLHSWKRCERGGHPYELEKNE